MRERYQNLSDEGKEKKRQVCERYKNLSEDEKQRWLSIEENTMKWVKMIHNN